MWLAGWRAAHRNAVLVASPNITLTDQKRLDKDGCDMWSGIWRQGYSQECRRFRYVPLTSAWFHPRHVLPALLVGNLLGVSDCNNYWGWFHVFMLETPSILLATKKNKFKVGPIFTFLEKTFLQRHLNTSLPRNQSVWGSGFGRCTRLFTSAPDFLLLHQTFYLSIGLFTWAPHFLSSLLINFTKRRICLCYELYFFRCPGIHVYSRQSSSLKYITMVSSFVLSQVNTGSAKRQINNYWN